MPSTETKARLDAARATFRAKIEQAGAARIWQGFSGRIAAVLAGGGARGAYEAGVLLAFQDARLPTHIITATSVGSINAASYAAHSSSLVGDAESLVETWSHLTPSAVGIEWTQYVWRLAGLVAAAAGFGNLLRYLIAPEGFSVHLHNPALTWLALGLAGTAVLLLYDRLPYLGYILRSSFRSPAWKPDRRKTALSIVANLIVWSFVLLLLQSLHLHNRLGELIEFHPVVAVLLAAGLVALVLLRHRWFPRLSILLHQLLRLPLRSGLFPNFERGRLLRLRISTERLRASPIRLIFTTTELVAGTARFFSNTPSEQLASDPGADARFVADEVETPDDLMRAVIASSALPIVYEPIPIEGRLYTDGGIVTNQPIRPAIRLGADVLFLVMVHTPSTQRSEVKTFIDIGLRALDILMLQSLLTDLKILSNVNALCERAAADLGLRPEEIEIDFGVRRYRYARAFAIRPEVPLGGSALDFSGATTGPAILQGYRDACVQIEGFLAYAPQTKFGQPKRLLRFTPERDPAHRA